MKGQGAGIEGQGSEIRDQRSVAPSLPGGLIGPAIVLLAAFIAITPQLIRGNSCGHDFDFHLVSWFDCLSSWRHGIAYPQWTPSANYGAGEPRFVFYPPLTWMLGAALGAVLPWPLVPIALTFLLLAGTGLATRALAREALDDAPATLAGCIAIFGGYALFTAYERSAFAELAGGFWMPLLLLFALRERYAGSGARSLRRGALSWRGTLKGASALALVVAGAWLSNPTVGVMAAYTLAALALAAALLRKSWAPIIRASLGVALGLGLTGAYLVPVTAEQGWADLKQVTLDPGQTLENNWLFARHADPILAIHDQVLRQVSVIAVLVLAAAFAGLIICVLRWRLPGPRSWWAPLALIPPAVLLLLLPISHWLWNLLPELRFLQFPWRWLVALEAPMAIFLAAAVWPSNRRRRIAVTVACSACFLGLTLYAGFTWFQACDDEDAVAPMLAAYGAGSGFMGTDEYEPKGADNSLVAKGLPAACLVSGPDTAFGKPDDDGNLAWDASQGTCESEFNAAGPEAAPGHLLIRGTVPQAGYLVLRLRSYPAWRVRVNGRLLHGDQAGGEDRADELISRDDGLICFPVRQGHIEVDADWTTTPDVIAGRWLTGVSVLVLAALFLLELRPRPTEPNPQQPRLS